MGIMLSYRHLSVVESTSAITNQHSGIVLFALIDVNYNFLFREEFWTKASSEIMNCKRKWRRIL